MTPSATAVGAQVRRILIETATGSTTLRFDEAGKPLTAALPYGETPWVRITAAGTDDGSAGVQFGITDLSITQYDASGFAHPVDLRHTVLVPGPPPGSAVAGVGPGIGTARQAGLRPGARRRALRGVDGAGAGGAGQFQPHADRSGSGVGDPDGVGAAAAGTEAGRSDRRAEYHSGPRRFRRAGHPRLGICGHRRRPGHRVDGTAAGGATQDPADADPDPAAAHRGRRAAAGPQPVDVARAPDDGGRQPRRRTAGPRVEGGRAADRCRCNPG